MVTFNRGWLWLSDEVGFVDDEEIETANWDPGGLGGTDLHRVAGVKLV